MTSPQVHLLLDALKRIENIATDSNSVTEGMDIAEIQSLALEALKMVSETTSVPRPGFDAIEEAAIALHEAHRPTGAKRYIGWEAQIPEYQEHMRTRVRLVLKAMGASPAAVVDREKHSFWCDACQTHMLHTDNQVGMLICDGCGAGHIDHEAFPEVSLPISVAVLEPGNKIAWRGRKLPYSAPPNSTPLFSIAEMLAYGEEKAYAVVEALNRKISSPAEAG